MERAISAIDDLPEEILVEILYRLRIKPLFRCKCVSKQLNSLISHPKFSLNYLQSSPSLSRLSALLDPDPKLSDSFGNQSIDLSHSDSTTDDDRPPSLHITLNEPNNSLYSIDASSDGLIVGGYTFANTISWRREIFVSNPLTNQSVKLPTLYLSTYRWVCGLATRAPQRVDENQDNFKYKVVFIQFISNSPRTRTPDSVKFATIDIFSSDTGRWARKERISWPAVVTLHTRPRLLNYKGILLYFDWRTGTLVTYDPYDSLERFGSIPLPVRSGEKVMNSVVNLIRLGLQDLIEFGEIEDCGDGDWRLCVWRLVDYDDKREWCLQKRFPISPQWNARLLVAPDPLKAELFCCLSAYKMIAHDLASAEKVCVNLLKLKNWGFDLTSLVPILLNPWSSPFHWEGEADRSSSSTTGFRKNISAWFPSYAK